MATTPGLDEAVGTSSAAQPKVPVLTIVMAVVVAVLGSLAAAGGVGFYLWHSGKIGGAAPAVAKATPVAEPVTHDVTLDPMVVNLTDSGGHAYLRIAITLREVENPGKKTDKGKAETGEAKPGAEPQADVRDTLLDVLGRASASQLLAENGKAALKDALKQALAQHNPDLKVSEIYFTEFLVQQ
ncbi:MAG: flagellar basal body-associated FliL family protein [Acidobacteriota bacterium]|nr:flagellar basal body-associated FliL family protein [Acidobacteriota bacterium]